MELERGVGAARREQYHCGGEADPEGLLYIPAPLLLSRRKKFLPASWSPGQGFFREALGATDGFLGEEGWLA